jgi:hypothetical protein
MNDDRWVDARRLEAWAGEVRVNLIRTLALIVFYAHHLLNVYYLSSDDQSLRGKFHSSVTVVVVAWSMAAFTLFVCLSRRWVPPALKYVACGWDLLMVTTLMMISPDGAHSPMVFLYFVVVVTAPLRLSLGLVWFATLGAMLCSAAVLWHYVYRVQTPEVYYNSLLRIPRYAQIIYLLCLGAVGILGGQMVRQARRLVQGYPVSVGDHREAA